MVLKKKIVVRVIELEFVCQTSAFFLTWYLIDRCQIVTDTYKKNVSTLVWKLFKSPLSLRK